MHEKLRKNAGLDNPLNGLVDGSAYPFFLDQLSPTNCVFRK